MKNIYLNVFVVCAVSMFVFSAHANSVHALSCLETTLEKDLDAADIVFLGSVTDIKETTKEYGTVTFEVSEYWKGEVAKKITINSQLMGWGMMEPFYKLNEKYVVFASNDGRGMSAGIDCGRTQRIHENSEILTNLKKGKIPTEVEGSRPFFVRDLTIGSVGDDVIELQNILESKGYLTMPVAVSKGYFGALTKSALAKYQREAGITPAVGYFGAKTRAYIK